MPSQDIYKWIPHLRDIEAGILYFVRKCCWFAEKRHCIVGWFSCSWAEEGFYNWEDDGGSDNWVVILSYITINKALWVFLHMILYLWILLFMNAIVWSMCFWFHIVYDVLYGYAFMVFCYFDSTGTLWSRTSRRGVANSIKGKRNRARIKAEDPGWSSFLPSNLSHLKELSKGFDCLFLR